MMKNPPHPGGIICRHVLAPLGLTISEAAKVLHVSRPALSNLVNERVALSPEMAIRFEKAFGADMETLMALQHAHDVALQRANAPDPLRLPSTKLPQPNPRKGVRPHERVGHARAHAGARLHRGPPARAGKEDRDSGNRGALRRIIADACTPLGRVRSGIAPILR